jgi:uncharacterized protein
MMQIEVCYVSPDEQFLQGLSVSGGCTVIEAIMASGLLNRFPNLQLTNNVGIYSKKVPLNQIVEAGDRIEVYRALQLTPNEARLLRAKTK